MTGMTVAKKNILLVKWEFKEWEGDSKEHIRQFKEDNAALKKVFLDESARIANFFFNKK
jgi:hypothetical protein